MADNSKIEWTDATWNPFRAQVDEIQDDGSGKRRVGSHCEHVSEGCRYCYAERINRRLGTGRPFKPAEWRDPAKEGYHNGEVRTFADDRMLTQPLRWKKPRRIFVNSMSDTFGRWVPDADLDRLFAVMALCPQHTFQVLTKRPERMLRWFSERWQGTPAQTVAGVHIPAGGETGRRGQVEEACQQLLDAFHLADPERDNLWTPDGKCKAMQWDWPLRNVWLGVSAEDQAAADARIALLLATPAALRFVSCEPLLGPIDLRRVVQPNDFGYDDVATDALRGMTVDATTGDDLADGARGPKIDWVIAGGESGPGARPMHPDWARSLRDQCAGAGVPFFFKQWGEWMPVPGVPAMVRQGDVMLAVDGERQTLGPDLGCEIEDRATPMRRVGKKAAGAMIDGKEHKEWPA